MASMPVQSTKYHKKHPRISTSSHFWLTGTPNANVKRKLKPRAHYLMNCTPKFTKLKNRWIENVTLRATNDCTIKRIISLCWQLKRNPNPQVSPRAKSKLESKAKLIGARRARSLPHQRPKRKLNRKAKLKLAPGARIPTQTRPKCQPKRHRNKAKSRTSDHDFQRADRLWFQFELD